MSPQGSIQVGTPKTGSNYGFCQLGQNPQSPWVLCISGPNKVPSKLEHQKPSVLWVLPTWPKPTVTTGFVYFRSQQGSIQVGTPKTGSNYGFCQLDQNPQSPWVLCISWLDKVPFKSEHVNSPCLLGVLTKKLENISKSKNQKFNMGTPSVRMVQKNFLTWGLMESSRSSCTMLWASWWAHFRQ